MKGEHRTGKKLGPRWRAPSQVSAGDELVYYTAAAHFELVVTEVVHGGAWVFGRKLGERPGTQLGPVAVPLEDCMTPTQARAVLRDVRHPDSICDTVDTHEVT